MAVTRFGFASSMLSTKPGPKFFVRHDMLMLCPPMCVYTIPTIALKYVIALRANARQCWFSFSLTAKTRRAHMIVLECLTSPLSRGEAIGCSGLLVAPQFAPTEIKGKERVSNVKPFVAFLKIDDWCRALICGGNGRHMFQDASHFMQLRNLSARDLSDTRT